MDLSKLESCLNWLTSYVESSVSMLDKFKTVAFLNKNILPTLYELAPRPAPLVLYRVQVLKPVPTSFEFSMRPQNSVVSWTTSSKKSDWLQISDDIGLLGEPNLYVLKSKGPMPVLTSPTWIKQLQRAVSKLDLEGVDRSRAVRRFLDIDANWQAECIVDCSQPYKVELVGRIDEDTNKVVAPTVKENVESIKKIKILRT